MERKCTHRILPDNSLLNKAFVLTNLKVLELLLDNKFEPELTEGTEIMRRKIFLYGGLWHTNNQISNTLSRQCTSIFPYLSINFAASNLEKIVFESTHEILETMKINLCIY